MAGLNGTITIKAERRPCMYKGGRYMFHKWFEEGGELNEGGTVDIGAILEDSDGRILKVWDIQNIVFHTGKLCDGCHHDDEDTGMCASHEGCIRADDRMGDE